LRKCVAHTKAVDACAPALYDAQIQWQSFHANVEDLNMRNLVIAIVMAAGASLIGATVASAAPANGQTIAQAAEHGSYVTDVAGGCGHGWHRNRWGHCVRW
jgi:hypothetical protein